MEMKQSERGYRIISHPESVGEKTSRLVGESSAIGEYDDAMDRPASSYLWIGGDHHLDREEVERLIGCLATWLSSGRLGDPGASESDNEEGDERIQARAMDVASWAATARLTNQPEWMEGLARRINEFLDACRDGSHVVFDGDTLQIFPAIPADGFQDLLRPNEGDTLQIRPNKPPAIEGFERVARLRAFSFKMAKLNRDASGLLEEAAELGIGRERDLDGGARHTGAEESVAETTKEAPGE